MKSQFKTRLLQMSRSDLVRVCNEKLVCAARDLAEFTQNGINASYIVALAHKCEHLEQSSKQRPPHLYGTNEDKRTETEIKDALYRICELGKEIWSKNPKKLNDYLLSTMPAKSESSDNATLSLR